MPSLRERAYAPTDRDQVGFDAGHRSVLRNNRISAKARLAFAFINSYATTARQGCFLGNARLAAYIGCSRRTVQRLIRELEEVNAIEVTLLDYGYRQIKVTGHVIIGNEAGHDTDVIPPATPMSHLHDTGVTLGMDKGIDLRNKNKAATAAALVTDQQREEQFQRFYNSYDPKAQLGDRKEDIRRQWNKTLAEGNDGEEIIAGVLRKKKLLELYKKDSRNEFESSFPYPVKFLRKQLWKAVGPIKVTKDTTIARAFDSRFSKVPPSFLCDLKRLKATDEELGELNRHWDFWQAKRLNEDNMTDEKLLAEVRASLAEATFEGVRG